MQVQSVSKLKRCYENPFPPDSIRHKLAKWSGGLSVEELNERAAGLQNWLTELLNRSKVEAWGQPTQAAITDFVKTPSQTAEELANAAAMQREQPWLRTSSISFSSLGDLPPSPPPAEGSLSRASETNAVDERSLMPPDLAENGTVLAFEGRFHWRPSRRLLTKFFTKSNSDWQPAMWQVVWLSSSKEEAVLLRFDDSGDISEANGNGASFSCAGGGGGVATGNEFLKSASMVLSLRSVRLVEERNYEDDEDEDDGMDLSVSMNSAAAVDVSGSSGEGTATGSSGHSEDSIKSSHGAGGLLGRHSTICTFQKFSVSGVAAPLSRPSRFEFVLTLMDGNQIFMAAADAEEREEMVLFLQSTLLRMAYNGRYDDVDLVNAVHQQYTQNPPQKQSVSFGITPKQVLDMNRGAVGGGSQKSEPNSKSRMNSSTNSGANVITMAETEVTAQLMLERPLVPPPACQPRDAQTPEHGSHNQGTERRRTRL